MDVIKGVAWYEDSLLNESWIKDKFFYVGHISGDPEAQCMPNLIEISQFRGFSSYYFIIWPVENL